MYVKCLDVLFEENITINMMDQKNIYTVVNFVSWLLIYLRSKIFMVLKIEQNKFSSFSKCTSNLGSLWQFLNFAAMEMTEKRYVYYHK